MTAKFQTDDGGASIWAWARPSMAVCLFLLSTTPALAQLTTGTISGTVTDSSGAAVPAAAVTVKNVDTGITRAQAAGPNGRYEAPDLPVGNYEVSAAVSGFQTSIRKGIQLTGVGEMTIRAGTSRAVVLYMKMGMSVDAAVREAVEDMRALKGGLINRVTIHAIDTKGNHKVVAVNGNPQNTYYIWRKGEAAPRLLPAEIVTISEISNRPSPSAVYGAKG